MKSFIAKLLRPFIEEAIHQNSKECTSNEDEGDTYPQVSFAARNPHFTDEYIAKVMRGEKYDKNYYSSN